MTTLSLFIPGEPVPKGAIKSVYMRGRMMHFPDAKTKKEMPRVIASIKGQLPENWKPLEGAVAASVIFYRAPPANMPKGRTLPETRPDLDNYLKLLYDCCTQAGVFKDDGQLVDVHARKLYGEPGIFLEVSSLQDEEASG